jgi:hypothetical protein
MTDDSQSRIESVRNGEDQDLDSVVSEMDSLLMEMKVLA